MEGKEVRFGPAASSALGGADHRRLRTGSVNAMHGSFMPLGGGTAMFLMQLGEIVPGGVGSGLYGMVVMALLAVFVAGLMVGRTPEYLGKKVEAREIKFAMLAVLILPISILGFGDRRRAAGGARRLAEQRSARPVRDPLRLFVGDGE